MQPNLNIRPKQIQNFNEEVEKVVVDKIGNMIDQKINIDPNNLSTPISFFIYIDDDKVVCDTFSIFIAEAVDIQENRVGENVKYGYHTIHFNEVFFEKENIGNYIHEYISKCGYFATHTQKRGQIRTIKQIRFDNLVRAITQFGLENLPEYLSDNLKKTLLSLLLLEEESNNN